MPTIRRRRPASPAWAGRRPIAVATLPGNDLYTRHLGHPEGIDAVHRTTSHAAPRTLPGPTFTPGWLSRHFVDVEVDVVHVHGLPPALAPAEVARCADAVRAAGKPLVVTGYHLSDPAGRGSGRHSEQLDALLPRADAVVTLTAPAAAEMRRRWGVEASVLPHPHAVDFVRMRQERPAAQSGDLVVGTHLAGLNLPIDPVVMVEALTRAVAALGRTRLVLHLHEAVLDPGSTSYRPRAAQEIQRLARARGAQVRVHRPFTESQLWDHLFSVDVSVVPGLHGSHSVWPEACADLGTRAVLPATSHAAAQRPCLVFDDGADADRLAESLAAALLAARDQGAAERADPRRRWVERVAVAESLRVIYERLLGLDGR